MNIRELSLRNYRVFEEVDLELPARVIGIFGPNGSGKSTLMESIVFALYGKARTSRNEIRTQGLLTDCEVRIVFDHGGSAYEVRRSIRGKNHATDAELFVGDLQLASGVTDVDDEIRKLLRMDQQVFRASVFAEQKQLDAFSDVTASKRKEMVLRLLGIRPVDDARAAARKDARAQKQSAEQLTAAVADVPALERALEERAAGLDEAEAAAKGSAASLATARDSAKAAQVEFERLDAVRQQVEKLVVELTAKTRERDGLVVRRDELASRVEQLSADLGQLPVIEQELASLAGVEDRLQSADRLAEMTSRLGKLEQRLEQLPGTDAEAAGETLKLARSAERDAGRALAKSQASADRETDGLAAAQERLDRSADADPTEPCPTCGRELGDGFAEYVKHCKQDVAAAKKAASVATKGVAAAEKLLARCAKDLERAERAAELARTAGAERGQVVAQVEELRAAAAETADVFDGTPPDLEMLRDQVRLAKELGKRVAELGVEQRRLKETQGDLSGVEEQLTRATAQLETLVTRSEALSFDADAHGAATVVVREATAVVTRAEAVDRSANAAFAEARSDASRLQGELAQAKETAARIDELRDEARYVERVSMLLDGFRDHLVARVGPELSRESEVLFRELTAHGYDDLKIDEESLTIKIADGEQYFDIDRFSGSETDLANLALRVAISLHLSRVSGADVGMMVLDEVLGSLDAEHKDLMVQVLGRLADRFHQLFVITHAEQIKDQFPASIEVRSVGRRRSVAMLV
ncbi:MAG: SMC family ATPase [Actinomycetota bacterium]